MNPKEDRTPNHLINEKSPYLLQHAYNPVDWYPWSEEAFTKAKNENKPIFLSIGYSTCHWCHVMERESFEDHEVAKLLNDSFISIKVDKEERPDVDNIYMSVCQALNGSGGWPLTIIMTPDQKPFFAGTYFPKKSKGRMMGMTELLPRISLAWTKEREQLISSSEEITKAIKNSESEQEEGATPHKQIFGEAYLSFVRQFDESYGGFHGAPKFPTPHNLLFLLRYATEYKDKKALELVEKTLDSMARGGIYDHIGGGFSRYSTDERWLVPHFEKMLYDNALLVMAYTEGYQVTKKPLYKEIVKETLQYILAEMTDATCGFYCAQDADSEGEEGKYYVFTPEEIKQVLGAEDGNWFASQYDITIKGNFEGKSIPNLINSDAPLEILEQSRRLRRQLYEYRKQRMKLHKDDKILTSWNSLMIAAFAKAYQVFGEAAYLSAAKKASKFIEQEMRGEKERLLLRYREGHKQGLGNLEDYSFYIYSQLSLYEATFDPAYLLTACRDTNQMIELFWDDENSGFYFYGTDAEELLFRPKEIYDGAIPSGNSVAAYVITKLAHITREDRYLEISRYQLEFITGRIKDYPAAYSFSLCALMLELMGNREIVCVVSDAIEIDELKQLLSRFYLPNTIVLLIEEHIKDGLALVAPHVTDYQIPSHESLIYICENYSCQAPISGMESLKQYLEN